MYELTREQQGELRQIKADYKENDVCMGDLLAATPVSNMTYEEAFMVYVQAMNWANGDEFFALQEDKNIKILSEP